MNVRKKTGKRNGKGKKRLWGIWAVAGLAAAVASGLAAHQLLFARKELPAALPDELLPAYMEHIQRKEYGEMYEMLEVQASGRISREDFINRNAAIYEGMETQNMKVSVLSYDEGNEKVTYEASFDTVAGEVRFENEAFFRKKEDGYRLVWSDAMIYPGLTSADKVRVSELSAKRGEITDRNGRVLAGQGVASSVGIVPGRLQENGRKQSIKRIASLLGNSYKDIKRKLSAAWVKEDSFVPVKTLPKVKELDFLTLQPDEEALKEAKRQQELLDIPGVMIQDQQVREYPLGEAAAHLVGYVQNVTAEDLEAHAGEGYTANSVIGRTGAESLYEGELKGQDGCRIFIAGPDGSEKGEIACRAPVHGKDIKLAVDAGLQSAVYGQFKQDKSCTIAMDPFTGEILAMASTPSYDNNDFILGLSAKKWVSLNEDEDKPLYNRFRQAWCPGSSLKPVIAAIGLDAGAINPYEDYGNVGLSWQKDNSWGAYYVTTLHAYEPVILENALIYSDNIYFAKAALKIGAQKLEEALLGLGFGKDLPFEISLSRSQYSNTEAIETEIQLADSGYGQGQILINPLHLACLYTAFCNEGNVLMPRLTHRQEAGADNWIAGAFTAGNTRLVLEGMKKVINDPHGTGYAAQMEEVALAGKTGTAEIKVSKDDTTGTELGWFVAFTPDKTAQRPILIVSMVEDVKGRGGSGYVVAKEREVLEYWFGKNE